MKKDIILYMKYGKTENSKFWSDKDWFFSK